MITSVKQITVGAMILCCAAVSANATDYTFDVSNGVWSLNTNWDPLGVPDGDDNATILNSQTCRVEADQSIRTLTINSGGVVQIKSADLTMAGSSYPLDRLTVNGRLEFLKPGNDEPRLLLAADLGITGSGTVSASAGDSLNPGIIEGTTEVRALTVNDEDLIMEGSLKFHVHIMNNGLVRVDHADDVMEIGVMAMEGPIIQILGDQDRGTFQASAGRMRFGRCILEWNDWSKSDWKVDGGTLELTEYAGGNWSYAVHLVTVSSGTLELNRPLVTTGRLVFTGGEIKVDAGMVAIFMHPPE